MKKNKLLLLSITSSLILSVGWPCIGNLAPAIFFGFVPLLFIENHIFNNPDRFKNYHLFNYSFVAFFFWNLFTTWWIYNASFFGVIMAVLLNSTYMATVFLLFHLSKKRMGSGFSSASLIFYWLAFEYMHLNWDLSWPWLTLGNSFANFPELVQWYEYTGVLGGSFWILVVNLLVFSLLNKIIIQKQSWKKYLGNLAFILMLLFFPIILSLHVYKNYKEKIAPVDVVIVQPNLDPKQEKFDLSEHQQLENLLQLSQTNLDSNVDYLVFPETALTGDLWENQIGQSYSVNRINQFLKDYPNLNLLTGITSYRAYENTEFRSPTAKKFSQANSYYDSYNTAMHLGATNGIQLYHKSKLVPGVEQTPFPAVFGHLDFLAVELGGALGSLGKDLERKVFSSNNFKFKVAPIICYESVFGEFVGEYVQNGANLIFIITNDGWWGDTPGYKQHLNYARLRAIETRRSIARSGNTGISAFLNQRGDIEYASSWWKQTVLRKKINVSNVVTFYVLHGDYIGRLALFVCFLMLIWVMFLNVFKKGKPNNGL